MSFLKLLSSLHPLSGHFRAAWRREGCLNGYIPVSVITGYDAKVCNLCKYINPDCESNSFLATKFVLRAAATLPGSVSTSEDQLSVRRQNPYPPELIESLVNQQSVLPESTSIVALMIPSSIKNSVEPLTVSVSANGYYLDVIARELGVTDASQVMVSRTIGKASSEVRLYCCTPKSYQLVSSSDSHAKEAVQGCLNERASYFAGHLIYGDAILASIGYTWRSTDLFYEDVSLHTYYRLLLSKMPSGIYKLSREAVLAAELPVVFTTRSNWRGSFPKDILCTFCRQHRLPEPVFSAASSPSESSSELPASHSNEDRNGEGLAVSGRELVDSGGAFRCEVKIFSMCQKLIIECSLKKTYKKQSDAIQNAALNVLSWLNSYFRKLDMSIEELSSLGVELDIQFYPQHFFKEFVWCQSVHNYWHSIGTYSNCLSQPNTMVEYSVRSINIEGPSSGVSPSSGSLASISISISLVAEGEDTKELLESSEEFEFEIGTGAVIPHLEAVVAQIVVGQSASFIMELPPQELVFAACNDSARALSLFSPTDCSLEYSIVLLRITEPLEERMEKALFSPPLSKQRVDYAVQHIRESCATSLVDFGCGSGSLLDSLLDYSTSLEKIVGVDISQKALTRAAKTLHSKLSPNSNTLLSNNRLKSALLYEGSVTNFDHRLSGFDVGTCLEVIEHMEEGQACLFGDIVLSLFCPRILIVSTPNFEYNVILQKSTLQSQDDDPDEKNQIQSCKFRNHDHKFEWTREQFAHWASALATRHNYSVEYSGVGGAAGVEPGFASQIAVFRRLFDSPNHIDSAHQYEVIWEWSITDSSRSAL
ncbi:hypothetical protein RJ639_043596 [Escallonia herrerae]|uniref:Small RNA 2'-O-methyltransferase n=1 Tax=Escallonia herrerae TaxID=1293975 RepID=A0AA89B824_9ASTE|nr:hypothetical protein RJ639_043596 [Escallonia herrerae]